MRGKFRHELIDRIIGLMRDAGEGILFVFGERGVEYLLHALRARVAIGDGIAYELIVCVKEHVIHTPGVDADRVRYFAQLRAALHAREHVSKERGHVPAVVTAALGKAVGKAIDFFHADAAVLDGAQNVPPAARADVNGQRTVFHTRFTFSKAAGEASPAAGC